MPQILRRSRRRARNGDPVDAPTVAVAGSPDTGPHRSRRPLRWLRTRALLAAALVLGTGASATAASWQGTEVISAPFTASRFGLVSTAASSPVAAGHPTAPGLTLTMTPPAPGSWLPGSTGYTWMNVATTAETDISAALRLTSHSATTDTAAGTTPDMRPWVTYRMVATAPDETCDASRFVAANKPEWLTSSNGTPARLDKPFVTAGATTIVPHGTLARRICIEAGLDSATPNTLQGHSTTIVWGFTATSVRPE